MQKSVIALTVVMQTRSPLQLKLDDYLALACKLLIVNVIPNNVGTIAK